MTRRPPSDDIDRWLAAAIAHHHDHGHVTTRYQAALDALTIGLSGRPAGNGEPGGGSSSAGSITERLAFGTSTLKQTRTRLEQLPKLIADHAHTRNPIIPTWLDNTTPIRLLVWARWATRVTNHQRNITNLWNLTSELDQTITAWTTTRTPPTTPGKLGLAPDLTGMWCRSCLRIGHREPRSDRYPKAGVCRWCGLFHAEHGWWPAPELLSARRDGRRITAQMIAASKPPRSSSTRPTKAVAT